MRANDCATVRTVLFVLESHLCDLRSHYMYFSALSKNSEIRVAGNSAAGAAGAWGEGAGGGDDVETVRIIVPWHPQILGLQRRLNLLCEKHSRSKVLFKVGFRRGGVALATMLIAHGGGGGRPLLP